MLLYIDELDARKANGVFYVTPSGGWIGGEVLRGCTPEQLTEIASGADAMACMLGTKTALVVSTACEEGYTFIGSEDLLAFSWDT